MPEPTRNRKFKLYTFKNNQRFLFEWSLLTQRITIKEVKDSFFKSSFFFLSKAL